MCSITMKIAIFLCMIVLCRSHKITSLDKVFKEGVDAYSKERWSECIVQFEEALHLYTVHKAVIVNCRLQCRSELPKSEIENIEDLKIFEYFINARQCITQCQQKGFDDVHMYNNVSNTVLEYMQARKPYSYLHICYFQMNNLPKAASATYTYLIGHPYDVDMKKNYDYYIEQPEVDVKEVIDLERDDYQVLYKLGVQAYKQKKWGETVHNMEEAIVHYLSWESSCRAECDRQPEQEWSPEFTITVSNNIASVLTCRQKCQEELKPLYDSGIEILADILNYIQISYYHLDRIDNAAKAVATYLALYPNDEDMLENKNIYQTLTDEKKFVEIPDIIFYYKRDKNEKQLLDIFHREDNSDPNANTI
ncbi:cartilage-associated protein [Bicyclus anynana]|uniref:Cartilage-associated protein n=1 Tax=Bicyclus anynana TaxID=110368 RepID=A0ABM3M6N8_BICAN|nr:cartilage-associated protein [Bicyclus anynana]